MWCRRNGPNGWEEREKDELFLPSYHSLSSKFSAKHENLLSAIIYLTAYDDGVHDDVVISRHGFLGVLWIAFCQTLMIVFHAR